jgi:putative ABC transport system permease protein
LNATPYNIVGVLPANFEFSVPGFFRPADIWTINRLVRDDSQRGRNYLRVIARLKPSVTIEQAQTDANAIASQLARQYPQANQGLGVRFVPLREQMVGDSRKPLFLLLGAVGFVLLIGCSNIANLQLERATLRQKEIAIRMALGASRARIVRELLTESVFLALLSGVFGIGIAFVSIKVLSTTFHGVIPPAALNLLDFRILTFTILLSFVAGIFFGIAPTMQRSSSMLQPIKEGVRGTSTSPARTRFRDLLVVTEFTLSLALLIGAGLLIQSFIRVLDIPLGFETRNVLLVFSNLPAYAYHDRDKQLIFYQQGIEQLQHVPGVQDVGLIDDLPLTPDRDSTGFIIEGNEDPNLPLVQVRAVSPGYFHAMRIPLIAGRNLSETDLATSPPVVLINQTMAKRFFAGQDPVGKHLKFSTQASVPWTTVVGVVGDVRNVGLEAPPDPEVYQPFQQNTGPSMTFVIKTTVEPEPLAESVRSTLHAMNRALPLPPTQTMEATFSSAVSARSLNTLLVGSFAAIALILATLGIYSVIAYSVTQRRQEIGVRMAVGAQPGDILRMVLKHGAILCSIGIVAGIVLIIVMTRLFSGLLFEVDSRNPIIFVSATALLTTIALSACVIPARRAMKVDPTESMR